MRADADPRPSGPAEQDDPVATPFERPEIMKGYPLDPEEQAAVEKVIEEGQEARERAKP
jgi:hypothetical protein